MDQNLGDDAAMACPVLNDSLSTPFTTGPVVMRVRKVAR